MKYFYIANSFESILIRNNMTEDLTVSIIFNGPATTEKVLLETRRARKIRDNEPDSLLRFSEQFQGNEAKRRDIFQELQNVLMLNGDSSSDELDHLVNELDDLMFELVNLNAMLN